MNDQFETRVRAAGVACRVETRDRLAVLVPDEALQLSADLRRNILQIARAEGFTHVAVELDPAVASLPRD